MHILLGGYIYEGPPYLNNILEFDYTGKLLKKYQTDCALTSIAINDSGEIIAFAINDTEDGYILKKGKLN